MQTGLFWKASLRLNEAADEVIRQAYLYAETPKNRSKLEVVVHDLLNHEEFHDTIVEDYIIDVLAKRAHPLKPQLIELRRADG